VAAVNPQALTYVALASLVASIGIALSLLFVARIGYRVYEIAVAYSAGLVRWRSRALAAKRARDADAARG